MERENDAEYGVYLASVGNVYDKLFMYDKAFEYYSFALPVLLKSGNQLEYGKSLLRLGKISDNLGDRPGALEFLLKALQVLKEIGDEYLLSNCYFRLGSVYNNLYEFDLAIESLEQSLALSRKENLPYETAGCLGMMGMVYRESGRYQKAIDYFQKALEMRREISGSTSPGLITEYFDIAQTLEKLGQGKKAAEYYQKALDLSNQYPDHYTRVSTIYKVGNFFIRTGKANQALPLFQEMIRAVVPTFTTENPLNHPGFETEPMDKITYIVALDEKAKALRGSTNGDVTYLRAADTCYQIILNQLDQLRKGFRSEQTKLEIQQQSREFYTRAMENCLDLHQLTHDQGYLNRAFSIAENSKTAALYDGIQMAKAVRNVGLPPEILDVETRIRVNIDRLEDIIFDLENREGAIDSTLLTRYWTEKYFLQQQYDSVMQVLEESNPDYDLKTSRHTIVSPTSIQGKLRPDQAFITYYLTDSALHGFFITQEHFQYRSQKIPDDFKQKVLDYREVLTSTDIGMGAYYQHAYFLYRILLKPFEERIGKKDLMIVPDGVLATLPFETLLIREFSSEEPLSKAFEGLLLNQGGVSYSYSSKFFLEEHKVDAKNLKAIAFAPSFNALSRSAEADDAGLPADRLRGELAELEGTTREINLLAETVKVTKFTNQDATELAFKENAHRYGVIHLATHAIINEADPVNSYLVFTDTGPSGIDSVNFEDNNLYAREIYNMRLNAQMAVLSACNTGFGKLQRGEGVMSLGRAFAYAGVPSIVMSLWPAEDESTADLMGYFYEGLADGQAKDEALRNAKLRFLKEVPPSKHHPFYWAGFVVQGDAGPLSQPGIPVWGWLIILMGTMGVGFFFLRSFKNR
jgi:CHAT domain-containing protein/TPR repeat protein